MLLSSQTLIFECHFSFEHRTFLSFFSVCVYKCILQVVVISTTMKYMLIDGNHCVTAENILLKSLTFDAVFRVYKIMPV